MSSSNIHTNIKLIRTKCGLALKIHRKDFLMYNHNVLLLSVVSIQLVFVFITCELCNLSLKTYGSPYSVFLSQ